MQSTQTVLEMLQTTQAQQLFSKLYGQGQIAEQMNRYRSLIQRYSQVFGVEELSLFSSPGRSEIGGNHTDHNYGKVLAGSINLDTIAAAAKTDQPVITLISEGYDDLFVIDLTDLSPKEGEKGTSALVRGIAAGFVEHGYSIGGFHAFVSSNVLSASGLSSSASFEMLICSILNSFYNGGKLDAVTMSKIGQFAENQYWHKPSGLLDQMACAHGGLIAIDFANPEEPLIQPISVDFHDHGYSLVIVNTGGNHADLTEDYAAVPNEMRAVAAILGAEVCRDITLEQLYDNMKAVRAAAGDRALLRAMHYLEENKRVEQQVKALEEGQLDSFLQLITESGNSSWKWLQNCYRSQDVQEQSISVALAITETYLKRIAQGACRVHGGGFAGVILTIIPTDQVEEYTALIDRTLATDVFVIGIREHGAICLNAML